MTSSKHGDFKFVDSPPPPDRGRNSLYAAFRDALRERPGEWGVYPREFKDKKLANLTAGNIKRDRSSTFPSGEFEATSSGTTVYVRYVGGES